ncbi:hypothetical protein COB52_04145 [Candidatus Kaiserbacteria bacterium]|nr:MAG: hypothetical protein COB52_04145 [Candidatus Kaiserbacteria bacterium]
MATKMSDFVPRTLVKEVTGTERTGVVVGRIQGFMSDCGPTEVPVVFDGNTFSSGTHFEDLEIIGKEEAVADFKKCGAGQNACIFLAVAPGGPTCERFGPLRTDLIFTEMKAARHPSEPFPECQIG